MTKADQTVTVPIRISLLLVSDSAGDARLIVRQLERSGYEVSASRVETRDELGRALDTSTFDVVVSDHQLPQLDALSVLAILRERGIGAPCLVVSGAVGEEGAADVMLAGARDVVMKGKLARLAPAVARELQRAAESCERARTEEALRQTDRGLRMTLERIPEGIVVHEDGRIVHANAAAAALLGGDSVEELIGRSFVIAPSSTVPASVREAAMSPSTPEPVREWMLTRLDGRFVYVDASSTPTTWSGRPSTFAMLRDVTQRREIVAKTLEADRVATLGTLAAGVGHEINNPLASILANVEFLTEDLEMLEGEIASSSEVTDRIQRIAQTKAVLAEIGEGGRRIRDIVADLQTLSRADEDIGPVDVTVVLESSLRIAAAETKYRACIVRQFEPVPRVHGSSSRLAQVFLNIIVNAAQAIEEGALSENEIRVRVFRAGPRVVVEVHDTGSGITQDHLRDIFTPFFTTKPVGQGTGLGLAICQRVVHSLGGEIEVESEEGRGSCFRVLLPVAEAPPVDDPVDLPSPAAVRILFIDDEQLVRRAFARHMSRSCDVVTASSASEGLALLGSSRSFDVIVCDLMMPEMTGMALYDEVVRSHPAMVRRMIFMTGGDFTPRARTFLATVTNPRIEKPLDQDQIRRAIAKIAGDEVSRPV